MNISPGTERAIQTLAEHLPDLKFTLKEMTKELKRYNDRVEDRQVQTQAKRAFSTLRSTRDP